MSGGDHFDEATNPNIGPTGDAAGVRLVVSRGGAVVTHLLPAEGRVIVGRAKDAAVRIDDGSISRHHVALHIGRVLRVEDLGSSNGTRVAGRKLGKGETTDVATGDVIDLGSCWMMLVRPGATTPRPHRLWPHDYFEGRLDEECARADRTGVRFSIARLHVEDSKAARAVEELLMGAVRSTDAVARYAPGEYEALLVDTDSDAVATLLSRVHARLGEQGIAARVGLAHYGRDGRTPDALLGRASAAVGTSPDRTDVGADIVLEDPAMKRLRALVERVAPGDISVLVLGETGAGKEVVAALVHRLSPRAAKPFVGLNCAALSQSLLESELFGHEKGAFTGATDAKPGLFESAAGGTVLLDEVGELPAATQVKLLRVLEERQAMRVGSVKPRKLDVRVLAATNRNLEQAVAEGTFRGDLYYRLNGVSIVVPPLRDRPADIPALARLFIERTSGRMGKPAPPRLSRKALGALAQYAWPGNIRELRNMMERAVLLCEDEIRPEHLPLEKMAAAAVPARPLESDPPTLTPPPEPAAPIEGDITKPLDVLDAADAKATLPEGVVSLSEDLEALERRRIVDTMTACGGNQSEAARRLGIARGTLIARLEAYGLPRPRKSRKA